MAKILYIDDEQILREVYTDAFKNEGFEVELASDGEEGLKKAQESKPHLILLDIRLPKLSGLEILKKLKENEETKHIPVIMLTNQSQEKFDVESAIKLGAVSYMVKANTNLDEVVAKVREILGGYVNEDTKMY